MHCQLVVEAICRTCDAAAMTWRFKKYILKRWLSPNSQPRNWSIMTRKLSNKGAHTWSCMLGYTTKDRPREAHYKEDKKGVTDEARLR